MEDAVSNRVGAWIVGDRDRSTGDGELVNGRWEDGYLHRSGDGVERGLRSGEGVARLRARVPAFVCERAGRRLHGGGNGDVGGDLGRRWAVWHGARADDHRAGADAGA